MVSLKVILISLICSPAQRVHLYKIGKKNDVLKVGNINSMESEKRYETGKGSEQYEYTSGLTL